MTTLSLKDLRETAARVEDFAAGFECDVASHIVAGSVAREHAADLRRILAALTKAQADAELCAQSWVEEMESGNATRAIARRLHHALHQIAAGDTPPEQNGHYLAHRRAVDIARRALAPRDGGGG